MLFKVNILIFYSISQNIKLLEFYLFISIYIHQTPKFVFGAHEHQKKKRGKEREE